MNAKERHLEALSRRYGIQDTERFWATARRAECKFHRLLEAENADNYKEIQQKLEETEKTARQRLTLLVRNKELFRGDLVFNRDPRGYALKLDLAIYEQTNGMYRDWGDYVIVAPDNFK